MAGDTYLNQIEKLLRSAKSDAQLFEAIVNAPFHDMVRTTQLDLGIVVLLLVNSPARTIERVALSDTEQAAGAVRMSEKPFKKIKIPVNHEGNLIAKAIKSGETQCITDWQYLFVPALSPSAARLNQAGAGIEFSCVHPLKARDGGALIFSFFQEGKNITAKHHAFMDTYADIVNQHLSK
ncbi:MAG TPA: hypothetical protein VIS56_00365 [Candidatus Saccharimonadales bacterium]